MSDVATVDVTMAETEQIPVLDQSLYPSGLPDIEMPDGKIVIPHLTDLGNLGKEVVLGGFFTFAIIYGKWKPVQYLEFMSYIRCCVSVSRLIPELDKAIEELTCEGMIQVVQYGETNYMMPEPEFARRVVKADKRFA